MQAERVDGEVVDAAVLIRPFITLDRIGALAGIGVVVLANAFVVGEPRVWVILPFLVVLVGLLTVARIRIDDGAVVSSLILVGAGNWIAAVSVSALFPFLWPAMVFTAVMPLMLATPYLDSSALVVATATTAFVGGLVAITGLLNDGGGAVSDIDDTAELLLVTGALVGHMVPMALIVSQHKRLQTAVLDDARRLNAELVASEAELAASRRRVAEAADTARSRIERDLHDGAQQRLTALKLKLAVLAETAPDPSTRERIDAVADDLAAALDELRELAQGIYPPVLETGGLASALTAVARRAPVRVTFDIGHVGRYPRPVESAVYFTALEALTNTAKHAPLASVRIRLTEQDAGAESGARTAADVDPDRRELVLEVADDGPGFDPDIVSSSVGLLSMADRITAAGGRLDLVARPGAGVQLTAVVPVDEAPRAVAAR